MLLIPNKSITGPCDCCLKRFMRPVGYPMYSIICYLYTTLGPVTMSFEGSTSQRSLWYANNSMDKIRLPPLQPPRTYANRVLLFHRKPNGFDLVIGTAPQASHWRNLSTQQKTIYQMKGGRQFGVFE